MAATEKQLDAVIAVANLFAALLAPPCGCGERAAPKPKGAAPKGAPAPCAQPPCCCDGLPCGAIFFCEDGVCTPIMPPPYFAVLTYDPARGCAPYWERPTGLGLPCPPPPPPPPG